MGPDGGEGGHERIRLPLWIHQVVEYLLALLIVSQSINGGSAATYIAVAGGLLFVLAATTDAPAGAVRWIPPQLHRVLDLVVIAALVLAPIVSGTTELLAWPLCLLAAGAVAWINWHTQWRRPSRRAARTDRSGTDPAAPSKPAEPERTAPPAPSKTASLGESARAVGAHLDRTTRGASRAAGRIYGRARARRPPADEAPDPNA